MDRVDLGFFRGFPTKVIMGRFDSKKKRQERIIHSVRYLLENVTVLCFQKVVDSDMLE